MSGPVCMAEKIQYHIVSKSIVKFCSTVKCVGRNIPLN